MKTRAWTLLNWFWFNVVCMSATVWVGLDGLRNSAPSAWSHNVLLAYASIFLAVISGIITGLLTLPAARGTVMCPKFPTERICELIRDSLTTHEVLTGVPITLGQAAGEYCYAGDYVNYLGSILDVTSRTNQAIYMTLPKDPYEQIYNSAVYGQFHHALAAVRKAPLSGKHKRKKLIVLDDAALISLRTHFAKDFIYNGGTDLHKYIRKHYGGAGLDRLPSRWFHFVQWWWNYYLRVHHHVDLSWDCSADLPTEYLLVKDEIALLYEANSKCPKNGSIVFDFNTVNNPRYRFQNLLGGARCSKAFFREIVCETTFYRLCAEYTVLKQHGVSFADTEVKLAKFKTEPNWSDEVNQALEKQTEEWSNKVERVTARW